MSQRSILRVHAAARDDIADLVTRRPLPGPALGGLDPFLLLNHHGPQVYPPGNRGLPFGPHPHRGFETVTLVVQGELAHRDSTGHESVITAGGVQWMTAGRGIVHEEVSPETFRREGGPLEILQLWINLPARLKMTPPRYAGLQRWQIPALPTHDGLGVVNLIAGAWQGRAGPVRTLTGVFMATVALDAGGGVTLDGLSGRSVLLYVVHGSVDVGDAAAPAHALAELSDGDRLEVVAPSGALLVLGHAAPLGEPVVAHGPFVMNTQDEVVQAMRDYQAGRLGK
jgi:redox-sensitive bicupin YhaK (pirin superfamily)